LLIINGNKLFQRIAFLRQSAKIDIQIDTKLISLKLYHYLKL
jgi:hypothetical protein